jgi:hypothetical protein
MTQDERSAEMSLHPKHKETPKFLLDVAFQPTARGEPRHFIAGNIRITNSARKLLDLESRKAVEESRWMAAHLVEAQRDTPIDDDWKAWFEFDQGLKDSIRSDGRHREKLIETDQVYYSCTRCGPNFSL